MGDLEEQALREKIRNEIYAELDHFHIGEIDLDQFIARSQEIKRRNIKEFG